MAYRDLREWIDHLDQEGELLRIKEEINLEPDAGAIGRAICDIQGPGILAENVAGFENRMSICLHASFRRAAMAMGLPKETSLREQKQAWLKAYDRHPIKPVMVKDAPCKDNILRGGEVDLFRFPIPRLNLHDASFYISKPMVITKDPDSDWVNVGMYRMMVLDRNRTCILAEPPQHIGEHYKKSRWLGRPLEVAVALGTEPVLPMVAGMKVPRGWSEFDYAGAVRGESMELVKAETVDLPVPATAEIVLEGVLRHDCQVFEGPFAEYTGCYSGYFMAPVFEITTITHRDNPIYDALYSGKPNAEMHYMTLM
ncbi:MAG: UbiD family decarboxylase, partial [Dehalococcoidia bacterium]|nr:UbiD family decarboxylase [Dehalococcoidia bacterium]